MQSVKQAIVELLNTCHVVPENIIWTNVGVVSHDAVARALSELTQANEIKRYEYFLPNEATRRCFYMRGDSRLAY